MDIKKIKKRCSILQTYIGKLKEDEEVKLGLFAETQRKYKYLEIEIASVDYDMKYFESMLTSEVHKGFGLGNVYGHLSNLSIRKQELTEELKQTDYDLKRRRKEFYDVKTKILGVESVIEAERLKADKIIEAQDLAALDEWVMADLGTKR